MNTLLALLDSIVTGLVRSTLQGSLLVLVVLGLRFVLARRLDPRWLHALWVIVLLRLAMLWTPESAFSLYGLVPAFSTQPAPERSNPAAFAEPAELGAPMELELGPARATPSAVGSAEPLLRGRDIVNLLWLSGAMLLLCTVGAMNLRIQRTARHAHAVTDPGILRLLEECRREIGLRAAPEVKTSDQIRSPILIGTLRPRLLLPSFLPRALDREQLRHVFLHELAHVRRRDIFTGWLTAILQAMHWVNPLLWLAFHRMRADRELACDRLVLDALPPGEGRAYAGTILKVLETCSPPQRGSALAALLDAPLDLKRRLTMITNDRFRKSALLGPALLVGLGCVGLTDVRSAETAAQTEAPASAASAGATARPAVIADSPDSKVDEHGRIVDRIDYPFVNDPQAPGKWETIDLVDRIESFDPKKPATDPKELFLKGVGFFEGGRASFAWKGWTKGLLMHGGNHTAAKYVVRQMGDDTYMFLEWKDEDYILRHQRPKLFVLRKLPADTKRFQKPQDYYAADKVGAKAELGPDSRIDQEGRIVDKVDYPFTPDPDVIGVWKSVDFVNQIKDFAPGARRWKGDLFFKGLTVLPKGRTTYPWLTWTRGRFMHAGDKTAPAYTLNSMDGKTYMFFEWKSGDYVIMHRKPSYYVLEKTSSDPGSAGAGRMKQPSDAEFNRTIQQKVDAFKTDGAKREDVIKVFGEPVAYLWGNSEPLDPAKLPGSYVMTYPAGFVVFISEGKVYELRFESPGPYRFEGKLKVGASQTEALALLDPPLETVKGGPFEFKDRVLYADINGRAGHCYYGNQDRHVRLWFMDGKVIAIYVTGSDAKPWGG